jgi:hypothetical protein
MKCDPNGGNIRLCTMQEKEGAEQTGREKNYFKTDRVVWTSWGWEAKDLYNTDK